MTWFLGTGIAGLVLLAAALVFDGVLEGVFGASPDGFLDGWLSLPVVAGFVSMTGFAGAVVLGTTGAGPPGALVAGLPAGFAAGWTAWRFGRALMRDQSAVAPRGGDLVGSPGAVVTAIPAGGYGEVLVRLAGQPLKLSAKCRTPVERGAEIWVEATLSPTSVSVRPVER